MNKQIQAMTNEQAIVRLQKVADKKKKITEPPNECLLCAIDLAILALQQYQPKPTREGCEWCKVVDGFCELDRVIYSTVERDGYDYPFKPQWPFCPNCGRQLKKEGE